MNWGDMLCGKEVTPEAWGGGVVELGYTRIEGNSWIITSPGYKPGCECSTCQDTAAGRPIFPPRGWAGKTDAELWAAMIERVGAATGVDNPDGGLDCGSLRVYANGYWEPWAYYTGNPASCAPSLAPPIRVSLQNYEVWARRMGWLREAK